MKAKITCRHCKVTDTYSVERHQNGAGYALEMTSLSDKHIKMLAAWLSSPFFDQALTKDQFMKYVYRCLTIASCNGRFSELKALHLIVPDKQDEGKYRLNFDLVCKVLNKNGKLDPIKTICYA